MRKKKTLGTLFVIVALLLAFTPARADEVHVVFHFTGICNNNAGDVEIGETQITVNVSNPGNHQVAITFRNAQNGRASSITDIYFQDGMLLGIASILNGPKVTFTEGANPGNVPCHNNVSPAFQATEGFLTSSKPPVQPNGVNPGEWVTITFNLQDGKTFADVISQLNSEDLRIAIHVQGFRSGGSESFITGTPTAITLASFGGKASRGLVTLNWATGTEISNAGFHLYRSTSADGNRARLTGALLAAQGDAVSGGSYSFVDAAGYGTYFYWLEDVSSSGKTTSHGPVQVTVAPPYRSPLYRPALPGGR